MDDHRSSEAEAEATKSRCNLENPGAPLIDVFPFCDQLEKFIKYIGSVRELKFLTYDYPNILKNRLDENVSELESVLAEVKDAAANADRLKRQKIFVKREKILVRKTLKRLRDDEVREMECVISLYDKPMFARWENVKSTQKPEVLEGILSDIKGKQLALENLNVLVTRKLSQIQAVQPILGAEIEKGRAGLREKIVIPLPFPSFCAPLLPPPPPPLPPPISASYLPKRSHAQRLSVQRRRRLERRDENLERRCVVAANVDELSLVPLTFSELPDGFYSTIIGATGNSSRDVVSANRTNDPVPLNNNGNGSDEVDEAQGLGVEFQNEMRTVLQALFGDLRSTPTLLPTEIINSGSTERSENAENTDREIELYAMGKRL